MLRKIITIDEKDFQEIEDFARLNDMKISSIFRRGAKELIIKENEKK